MEDKKAVAELQTSRTACKTFCISSFKVIGETLHELQFGIPGRFADHCRFAVRWQARTPRKKNARHAFELHGLRGAMTAQHACIAMTGRTWPSSPVCSPSRNIMVVVLPLLLSLLLLILIFLMTYCSKLAVLFQSKSETTVLPHSESLNKRISSSEADNSSLNTHKQQ